MLFRCSYASVVHMRLSHPRSLCLIESPAGLIPAFAELFPFEMERLIFTSRLGHYSDRFVKYVEMPTLLALDAEAHMAHEG